MRKVIAVYIDLENVAGILDLDKMLQDIILEEQKDEPEEHVFAVKFACGDSRSIAKLRKHLVNHNFAIREAPHISGKKNRADLIISMDAFEKLYLDKPSIDRFVFVTSDSDFSVIMDILRKYGREVWLITKEGDELRPIFTNSTDNIITIPQKDKSSAKKIPVENKTEPVTKQPNQVKTKPKSSDGNAKDDIARELFIRVLKSLDPSKDHLLITIANKMRQLDKSFKIKNTSFKKMTVLAKEFEKDEWFKSLKNKDGHLLIHDLDMTGE
ncbi:NYN domain-containing protein [candidate division KSB1 bacterium]|nr:NYN domain-containing protein [candidate division KSB1 bacterium]